MKHITRTRLSVEIARRFGLATFHCPQTGSFTVNLTDDGRDCLVFGDCNGPFSYDSVRDENPVDRQIRDELTNPTEDQIVAYVLQVTAHEFASHV